MGESLNLLKGRFKVVQNGRVKLETENVKNLKKGDKEKKHNADRGWNGGVVAKQKGGGPKEKVEWFARS